MELVYKRLVPLVYLHVGLHIVSDARAGKAYKVAGKRSTGAYYKLWLACCTAYARFVVLFFFIFVFPFCPRSSLYSQIMRLDMTYRIGNQSIFSQSVSQSSPVQSSPAKPSLAQPSPTQPPAPPPQPSPASLERLGNMGFTIISLSCVVKTSLGVRHSFLCNNLQ